MTWWVRTRRFLAQQGVAPAYRAVSVQDGKWSDPRTWKHGAVPEHGDFVVIHHHVQVNSDAGEGL